MKEMIPTYQATIVRGRYWNVIFKIKDDALPDLTGVELKAQFRKCADCQVVVAADIIIEMPITVKVELSADKTKIFENSKAYGEVSFVKDSGDPVTLFFIEAEIVKPINDYDD